jgi:flagellar motor switch protein FliG
MKYKKTIAAALMLAVSTTILLTAKPVEAQTAPTTTAAPTAAAPRAAAAQARPRATRPARRNVAATRAAPAATATANTATPDSTVTMRNGKIVAEEETSAVERAIEGRVRDVLSGMMGPDKFAVFVQVNFQPDPKTLQQYYEERAITSVPGIMLANPTEGAPANNKLYSLVDSKKIIVVLDRGVSAEQEAVAREVLISKLGIDASKGDTLDMRRTAVTATGERSIASETKGQTPTWVKWVFILLGAALVAAVAILLWQISLLRERVEARAKMSADLKVDKEEVKTEGSAEAPAGEAGPEEGTETTAKKQKPVSVYDLKEKILGLVVANPKACSVVARRLFANEEGVHKLAVACEAIGFEYCKQLFDNISPSKWRKVGEYLKANMAKVAEANVEQTLQEFYTDMLAESLGWDPQNNGEGPFDFLQKLSSDDLKKLFRDEEPNNIALIAGFWEPADMTQILDVLPEETKKLVVLNMSRLNNLPKDVVESAGLRFANRIKTIRSRQEVDVNGSEIVAKILGTVDSTMEEQLLSFIEREDPEMRERLRAYYFSFDSLPTVPDDVLAPVLETTSTEELTAALVGADQFLQQKLLSLLAPKQRAIVQDDVMLASAQASIAPSKTSAARRKIATIVKKAVAERGMLIAEMLAKSRNAGPSTRVFTTSAGDIPAQHIVGGMVVTGPSDTQTDIPVIDAPVVMTESPTNTKTTTKSQATVAIDPVSAGITPEIVEDKDVA